MSEWSVTDEDGRWHHSNDDGLDDSEWMEGFRTGLKEAETENQRLREALENIDVLILSVPDSNTVVQAFRKIETLVSQALQERE